MNTISHNIPCLVAALTFALLVGTHHAAAQSRQDTGVEVSLIYGQNRDVVSMAEPAAAGLRLAGYRDLRIESEATHQHNIGLNVAGRVSRYLLVFSEFMYNDLGESRISGRALFLPRADFTFRRQLFEWTSGARVVVPTGASRVQPYFGGGVGTLWAMLDGEGHMAGGPSVKDTETASDLTYHLGVGVRVFATSAFGVAPEFRVVQIPDETYYRVLINAIFRFH